MNPWDRQEGETPKAYAAFCAYRDLGTERSLEKVGGSSAKVRVCERWSSRYSWPARAAAWDEHLREVKDSVLKEGIRDDRVYYRDTVKKEAADFAAAAIKMRKRAEAMADESAASAVLSRAASVWEKARQVEGIALGLVSDP